MTGSPISAPLAAPPCSSIRAPVAKRSRVERYRATGRAALDTCPEGWHQVNIEFADYSTCERAFRAYLLPSLRDAPVGAWWFLREYPCWRLRFHPSADTSAEDVVALVTEALDRAGGR
ncbi:lantibiotic dehydratase C-terminal domain-containing protein [Streptomyces europaeiscabiei]|uniref:lantibiotic dehydratase C-terminal domain-containing protein n=1 Tax=Streptomyces europaeiscabiei TaxID=146819 RepID=UPI00299FFE1C|nr:lantibiotic dehydratase C-terminal domain-containing protein [Streptomyces europaeiscabiei]MDX3692602.1 lantibiotic dehydratase C-terminal domain-containing protein [Streptomyces europaeiscabiei]